LYARIFYAGWRDGSGCDTQYVHPNTIRSTIIDGITKGKYDIVIDGKSIMRAGFVRERRRQSEVHGSEEMSDGEDGYEEETAPTSAIADTLKGSESEADEFVDALEHLTLDGSVRVSPCIATPAVPTLESTSTTDLPEADNTLDIVATKTCHHQEHTTVFCCCDSATMFWNPLMGLLRELREMVYSAHFAGLPPTIILHPHHFDLNCHIPSIIPAFCYINKQVFVESIPMLLREKLIIVGNQNVAHDRLAKFLDQIPENAGYKAIRQMRTKNVFHLIENVRTTFIRSGLAFSIFAVGSSTLASQYLPLISLIMGKTGEITVAGGYRKLAYKTSSSCVISSSWLI
jgi:hypothetical protein